MSALISDEYHKCTTITHIDIEDSTRERTQQAPSQSEHQTVICLFTAIDARHCNGPQDAEISFE